MLMKTLIKLTERINWEGMSHREEHALAVKDMVGILTELSTSYSITSHAKTHYEDWFTNSWQRVRNKLERSSHLFYVPQLNTALPNLSSFRQLSAFGLVKEGCE